MSDSESEAEEVPTSRPSPTNGNFITSIPRTPNLLDCLMRDSSRQEFLEMEDDQSDGDDFDSNDQDDERASPMSTIHNQFLNSLILENLIAQANSVITTPRWALPSLPNNQLIQMLDRAAELVRDASDVPGTLVGNQIDVLLGRVLLPTLSKVLQDEMNLNMELNRMIMSCMYRVVTIFVAKLRHGHLPLDITNIYWQLFRLVMITNNRFYHKTLNYSSENVVHIIPGDVEVPSEYLKRDKEYPDWYATVFLWFHKLRGFQYFTEWANTKITSDLPFEDHFPFIEWIVHFSLQFKSHFNRTNILPFMKPFLDKMMRLTEEDVNRAPLDLRDNLLNRGLIHARIFITSCAFHEDNHGYASKVHYLLLKTVLRSIVGGNFLVRIVAIEEFQRLICLSDLVEMNEDGLKSFIKNENVVEILYKDNLHHMAYVERLLRTMNQLLERHLIDSSVLDIIWEDQLGKHDAIVRNVIILLSKISVNFPNRFFTAFFHKLEKCWNNGDDKVKDLVLDLMKRVGAELSCQVLKNTADTVQKIVDILWRWSSDTPFDSVREKIYTVLFDILQETVIPRRNIDILEHQILQIAEYCLNANAPVGDNDPIALSLHFLKKLICLIPEEKITEDSNRRLMIRTLDDSSFAHETSMDVSYCFSFGKQIAQNICDWIEAITPRLKDSPENSMETDSTESESSDPDDHYFSHLRKRLDFLHFLIIESRRCYKEEFALFSSSWIYTLWDKMINVTSHSLQSIGFRFFRDVVTTLLDCTAESGDFGYESHIRFFESCVLKVNPTNLSNNGFRCFSTFLKFVNISKGVLQFTSGVDLEDDDQELILKEPDFEGEDYLRQVIIYAEDLLQKLASNLLERMYSSFIRHISANGQGDKIVVTKCVDWLEKVDKERRKHRKDIGDRMIKNTILTILEVVEKNETDVKLVVRERPSLRRAIAIHGFKCHISFKPEDIQMLFSTSKLPSHFDKPIGVSLNDNMVLYELILYVCRLLSNHGGEVSPYPLTVVKKNAVATGKFGSKLGQSEWGYTMREVGIREPGNMTIRTEKSKVAVDPETDATYSKTTNPELCSMREQRMLSCQLAEHPNFIEKLLQLADENELLEYCFQLLASLPIKRRPDLDSVEAFVDLLNEIHSQESLAHRLYLLFVLYEHILPAKNPELTNNSVTLERFYDADGVSSLLKLFSRLSTANEYLIDFEMFCCDILFRLVPAVVYIYLLQNDKSPLGVMAAPAREMFYKMKCKMDPFVEDIGRNFNGKTPLFDVNYDLDVLLSIVRAGSKFLSNSNGNIFYSAILEGKVADDDEALLDEDSDPAEDQADMMVFNCATMLSLLAMNKPEKGRELLESHEFHKFMVDCCISDSANEYNNLIPFIFHTVEKVLETDHLMEGMIDYMFTRLDKGTNTFWNVLCTLINLFIAAHLRPLKNIKAYIQDTVEWLKAVQKECEEAMCHYSNQSTLSGRLQLLCCLIKDYTTEMKGKLGIEENMIERLLYGFLIPSSREFYLQKHRENGLVRSQTTMEGVKDPDIDFFQTVPRSTSCLLPSGVVAVCRTEESQMHAYNLLVLLGDHDACLQLIIGLIKDMFYSDRIGFIPWDYQPDNNLRSPGNFVGLKNGGATCYMNSILQQLFMIPEVRDPILHVMVDEDLSNQPYQVKILAAIQSVFANLAGSELEAYTPDEFWNIFQLNERIVNVHEQQDAYEFYNKVVDLIDEGMEKLGAPKVGTTIFGGNFADEKICKDCPHRYSREEPFTSISIDVRSHNNMVDSLNEFVRGDVLENDNAYHCEKCDKKVRAVKRMTIKSLPETLVVQLKRFEFDWERNEPVKFNDYFEFPFSLDMSPYTTEVINARDNSESESGTPPIENNSDLERYIYRLRGVVVHSGQATGGHYFSYIRNENNQWFKFDDTEVTVYQCDPQDVKHKWFGEEPSSTEYGRRRSRVWWNAFILFYEKITPPVAVNKPMLNPIINLPGVPLTIPLTVDPNLPVLDSSRRSSTASPVTRLHKRFSNMSLKSRSRFIPPRLEVKVRNMNTRIMHEKNEFSYSFFDFMHKLMHRHIARGATCDVVIPTLDLGCQFMFHTLIRSNNVIRKDINIPFNKNVILYDFIQMYNWKTPRTWFTTNVVLNDEIARNFLMHLPTVTICDKYFYVNIVTCLLEHLYQCDLFIDELLETNSDYLIKFMEKRRYKSNRQFDLLLEFVITLFKEEYSDELVCLLHRLHSVIGDNLMEHLLKTGFLSACIKYLETYQQWDHPSYNTMLQLSALMFACLDLRSLAMSSDKSYCPYLIATEEQIICLEDCFDYNEVTCLFYSVDKLGKYLDLLLNHMSKDSLSTFARAFKCLCWNNFHLTKKAVIFIFRHLQLTDTKTDLLLRLLYEVASMRDANYKESRLLKWFIKDFDLSPELFSAKAPTTRIASFTFVKSDSIRKRILMAVVIVLEAYGRPEDPDFDGPSIYEAIRATGVDFFHYMAEFYLKSQSVSDEVERAFADLTEYTADMPKIPTVDDAKIRLLIKYREAEEAGDMENSSVDNSENEMDTDEEQSSEQPLDLSLNLSARSSVTTPMLAEKRTLLQEDDEPPNAPAEAKKSRYSDNGEADDTELLINTSTSALEIQEIKPSVPPPPYEDESQA